MKVKVFETTAEMGRVAAKQAAEVVNGCIKEQGYARILLSTGASQFTFFENFVKEDIDWSKVEMFHLDEYVGISEDHPASFKRYLLDRFINIVNPGRYHLINGEDDPEETIAALSVLVNEKPIDLGMIGIGENGHIAFNDPPADFEDTRAYKVVTLDQKCLNQQIGEGWFKNIDETYKQAISMTCPQIMKCKTIISYVPYAVKAQAVRDTLTLDETNLVPATVMKRHGNVTLYCDRDSASMVSAEVLEKYL